MLCVPETDEWPQVLMATRYGGTVRVYGALTSFDAIVNVSDLMFKEKQLLGFWLSSWLSAKPKEEQYKVVQVSFVTRFPALVYISINDRLFSSGSPAKYCTVRCVFLHACSAELKRSAAS